MLICPIGSRPIRVIHFLDELSRDDKIKKKREIHSRGELFTGPSFSEYKKKQRRAESSSVHYMTKQPSPENPDNLHTVGQCSKHISFAFT